MRRHAVALILAILLTLPEAFSQLNMVNSYLDILSERQGWGKNATGGADGSIFHVTSLADSGPGTLRDGLNRDEPLWIVFDVSGEIVLSSPLVPKSNKTIDGRGQAINVRSKDHNVTGFKIHGVNNLILLSFTMDDKYPDWMMDSEAADGINIVDSADVWIHHMHFARWRDGAIDMRGGAKNISVTWSRFEKIFQALNWTGSRLSFGYNYCSNVSRRCIQMIKGKAHSYNNLIERWGKATIQNAKDGAQILSEKNLWLPGGFNQVNSCSDGGKIRMKDNYGLKPTTFLGCQKIDSTFVSSSRALAKITSPKSAREWDALRTKLTKDSGPYPLPLAA
jgi:pectate lyase